MSKIKPIYEYVNELPATSMTVRLLQALDWVVPGQWQNVVGFEKTITHVTGETDPGMIKKIGERAIHLYYDGSQGYQRALWLYQTIDYGQGYLGTAAMANKIGEKISFLSFLNKLTPKADTIQTVDLSVKLVTELVAFCMINGIPGDSISDFVKSLVNYSGESAMRMGALICIDGLLPLGPDFISMTLSTIDKVGASALEQSEKYKRVKQLIPGGDAAGQLSFIQTSMKSVKEWMVGFVADRHLDVGKVLQSVKGFVDVADDKLDFVAAFLDMTCNYYEHTGIQTLARSLIDRAVNEV